MPERGGELGSGCERGALHKPWGSPVARWVRGATSCSLQPTADGELHQPVNSCYTLRVVVRPRWEGLAGSSPTSRSLSQGLDRRQQSLEAVFALRELSCLKDPALLSLEVLGFITKYPDAR